MSETSSPHPDSSSVLRPKSSVIYKQFFAPLHNLGLGIGIEKIDFGPFTLTTLNPEDSAQLLTSLGTNQLWEPLTTTGYVYLEKKEAVDLVPEGESKWSNAINSIRAGRPAGWSDQPYDAVRKERLLLNLVLPDVVDTPVVYWADKFPLPNQVVCVLHRFATGLHTADAYFDTDDLGENERMVWGQEIQQERAESILKIAKKAWVYLSQEFLELRPRLQVALDKYADGCEWLRPAKDRVVDFIASLEALYVPPNSTLVKQKFAQSVSLVLGPSVNKHEVRDELIRWYDVRSNLVHGGKGVEIPTEEEIGKLRNYAKQGILIGLALRQNYTDDSVWESWCSKLDLASSGWDDKKVREEIRRARAYWEP